MDGIKIYPLRKIHHPKGDIFHALKHTDDGYRGFGEAYFTTIKYGEIKGWKKHLRMWMNLIVPVGMVRFTIKNDSGQVEAIEVGDDNYVRLVVEPGNWVSFEGLSGDLNLVLNIANLEHDPDEAVNIPIEG
ncbi:hypothetical protein [Acidihalobacter aeolianus]|uniref:hypothetical protein n=1 Tax=Acidihalobacter aeolianus TaxID=2792603 RepID=UPI0009F26686|nr:hypothetical protein [Acidihalobacter aeolianus]